MNRDFRVSEDVKRAAYDEQQAAMAGRKEDRRRRMAEVRDREAAAGRLDRAAFWQDLLDDTDAGNV